MKEEVRRRLQEPPRSQAPTVAYEPQKSDSTDSTTRESDDRRTPDVAPRRSDSVAFRHKLLKRPRSPQQQPPPPHGLLPPITAMPVQERQERQLRSFLRHFLVDESGRLATEIDLQQHALDSGVAVTDATVQAVVSAVPAVRSLRLAGCAQVTDAGVWAIARQCAQLETIDLSQCERVTELGLRLLAHHCSALVSVDLSECPQVTDTALQTLAAGCWQLQTLSLARCNRVTDAGVAVVAQCCRTLRRLNVSECARVGEFGDQALSALGRCCPQLVELDLFGCRHVHDAGLLAIAKGCRLLTTLKLSGCRDVTSAAIRALASQCRALQTLSLAGCVQTTNDDVCALAAALSRTLRWLDISGSPRVDARGVRALAQCCRLLTFLSLAGCERVSDSALEALGTPDAATAIALTTLSLAHCPRVTEAGLAALTRVCVRLTTLDVTGCAQIGRRFLQALVARLEVVEYATAGFFGFQPLPHAAELVRQRERRRLERRSCVAIQKAMRSCLARGGLYAARRQYVETRVLPKLQARVRGARVRRSLAREQRQALEDRAAAVIGHEWRSLQLRRLLVRTLRLRRIQTSEDAAARVFQRLFRGHHCRQRVRAVRETVRQQRQLDARVRTLQELAAARLQRFYRGHRGRCEAAIASAAKAAQRRQADAEQRAVLNLQRVWRGRQGRHVRAQRLAARVREQRRQESAVMVQKLVRGHFGRQRALVARVEAAKLRRVHAALVLQRHWRGLRDKHLAAVLLGLCRLREREQVAAERLQRAYRAHVSRSVAQTLRLAQKQQRKRSAAATHVQRVLRGHRGREAADVQRELAKLATQARPLFAKRTRLQTLAAEQRSRVDALAAQALADEADERLLAAELHKTLQVRTPFHDSSRLAGSPQRFRTQYVQVQLADELRAKRLALALDARTRETLTTALHETETQLRVVERALEPLTTGVAAQTKARRRERLQTTVRRRRAAAVSVQRVFRGFRVRCAMREGANCWLQLGTTDAATETEGKEVSWYYYNVLTGVTRWTRPLAMDIFHDTFVSPMAIVDEKDKEKETTDETESRGDDRAHQEDTAGGKLRASSSLSSDISGGAWYEAFDDALQRTYYYHSGTREYQWEPPLAEAASDVFVLAQEASRRRHAWLHEQQQQEEEQVLPTTDDDNKEDEEAPSRLEALLASTTVSGERLGPWERRVEPVSTHWFFYHPGTGELRPSLSPRTVHASISGGGSESGVGVGVVGSARRSARSLSGRRQRPLHWQFRYGYAYDASGRLVTSAPQQRSVWTAHDDPESGLAYYHNALSDEYRWEEPADFHATYEELVGRPNASREWFVRAVEEQKPPQEQEEEDESSRRVGSSRAPTTGRGAALVLTTRSSKTRALGRKWVECVDAETQHTYYYNEVTGEARWSLSPRSARDAADSSGTSHMTLALYEQVARLRTAPVAYDARDEHLAWLEAAVADKQWATVEAIVHQMELREQSQQAVDRKSGRVAEEEEQETTGGGGGAAISDAFNSEEETRWTDFSSSDAPPQEEAEAVEASEWMVAYDGDGNAYYYSTVTGETSWTDPSAGSY